MRMPHPALHVAMGTHTTSTGGHSAPRLPLKAPRPAGAVAGTLRQSPLPIKKNWNIKPVIAIWYFSHLFHLVLLQYGILVSYFIRYYFI